MKKFLSVVLAMVMMLSLAATAGAANTYNDMPTGWSHNAMQAAVDNGIMSGNEKNLLMPKGTVTRAQAATMLVNALGGTVKADISKFTDVKSGDWFYEKMAVAVNMGLFAGSGSKLEPNKPLTREQAAVVISRALWLMDKSADLSKFADSAKISTWAKDGVAEMVKAGYMSGSGSMINPQSAITREEFAQILYSVVEKYVSKTGTYKDTVNGNLVVRGKDVTLDGATVKGDLIVGDGAGDSTITVKNTTISGRVVVRGGGVNSVVFTNTKLGTVVVARPDGAVKVSTDAASTPAVVYAEAGKTEIVLTGTMKTAIIETATPVIFDKATVQAVSVTEPKANVKASDSSSIGNLTVNKAATGTKVNVESTAKVDRVAADSNGVSVTGKGSVGLVSASVSASNVTVTTPNTDIVNNGSTPVETNKGNVPTGYTGTTNQSGEVGTVKPIVYYKMTITLKDNTGKVADISAATTSLYLDGSSLFYAEAAGLYDVKNGELRKAYNDKEALALAEAAYSSYRSDGAWSAFTTTYASQLTGFSPFASRNVTFDDLVGTHQVSYKNSTGNYTVTVTITAR
jgi:hypothetical protein